jgi:hypothetical protein
MVERWGGAMVVRCGGAMAERRDAATGQAFADA